MLFLTVCYKKGRGDGMKTHMALCRGTVIRYHILSAAAGYGIAVVYRGEQAVIEDLTSRREEIEDLVLQLRKGRVTPVALRDVVEDWLLR